MSGIQAQSITLLLSATLGISQWLQAHELITTRLTFTEQVSRIFFRRCAQCHREGGSAPMPLTTYRQVRPWAKAIKYRVLDRTMPPWGPVKGYGSFRNDPSLTEWEIAVIASWVEGGAPEGDEAYIPPIPPLPQHTTDPPARVRAIQNGVRFDREITAVGVRPGQVNEGGAIQIVAELPNG